MESKIDQNESMTLAFARDSAEARRQFHDRVSEMVEDQQGRRGGRMLAYLTVARWLRVSDTWVRRLVKGEPVKVSLEILCAADSAYAAHCARVMARAEQMRAAAAHRRRNADAILAGLDGLGPGGIGRPGEPPAGTAGASRAAGTAQDTS